jgi:subtilisin family serine protease
MPSLSRVFALSGAVLLALVLGSPGGAAGRSPLPPDGQRVEVIVTLPAPPLAEAVHADRALAAAATKRRRLDLRRPASVSYLRTLAQTQRSLQSRIVRTVPDASVRWRYGVVLNGLAVVVPRDELATLKRMRGVSVWPSVRYHALLDRTVKLIGAPTVWGPTLATAGEGTKIGIIDDGVDQAHPFFSPKGFTYPAGFPKGQKAYTTQKVIVARTFAPADETWKYARRPFDPKYSDHATHVAGIAAGDFDTLATGRERLSGVAPKAWIGNYKALTVPTRQFGLDGNSPEIAAAIEQAVKDGMDVLNLSLGEPEIQPSRDVVVRAIDNAVDAGVVVAVAAGNDFDEAGRGSVGSPANAPKAIAVAASSSGRDGPADVIADFSSSGPTPVTFEMKPDVTAPGEAVLSSVPPAEGSWAVFDGTSMASPHVAAAAAILRQRHPSWTPAEIKSALESTGDPVTSTPHGSEALTTREGGGRIDLPRADSPLVFTAPAGLSFGLVRAGTRTTSIAVTDAGGGPEPWAVDLVPQVSEPGVTLTVTPTVAAPGSIGVQLTVAPDASERDVTGFVRLTRDGQVRRIPYWFRVEAPKLGTEPFRTLVKPGLYRGNTRLGRSLVSSYRYPERQSGVPTALSGPEQVFHFRLARRVANFGAVVVSSGKGVRIQPRLVIGGDENRLVGYTGYPVNLNPYQNYGLVEPVVGAVLPDAGDYDFVFDTAGAASSGPFAFRFWVDDVTPPSIRLLGRRRADLVVRVTDSGSGVDPQSLTATVDGARKRVRWSSGRAVVRLGLLTPGRHRLAFTASDYQEAKNMEDVGPVLPNTRVLRTTFRILG